MEPRVIPAETEILPLRSVTHPEELDQTEHLEALEAEDDIFQNAPAIKSHKKFPKAEAAAVGPERAFQAALIRDNPVTEERAAVTAPEAREELAGPGRTRVVLGPIPRIRDNLPILHPAHLLLLELAVVVVAAGPYPEEMLPVEVEVEVEEREDPMVRPEAPGIREAQGIHPPQTAFLYRRVVIQ